MKKYIPYFILFPLCWALLLILLVLFEGNTDASGIHTFWDALWYSFVTLTTVGYGDLYPVTIGGKVIGIIFVFLSLGLLSTLIGYTAAFLKNRVLPLTKARTLGASSWYVFTDNSPASLTLAEELLKKEPACALVFPSEKIPASFEISASHRLVLLEDPLLTVSSHKFFKNVSVFCIGDCQEENLRLASEAVSLNLPVYAASDTDLDGVHTFRRSEASARVFWLKHPLTIKESSIVLIGFGPQNREILSRALLTNLLPGKNDVSYHVFGSSSEYQKLHYHLCDLFAINEKQPGKDAIFFHEDPWMQDPSLLETADRLILCTEDDPSFSASSLSVLHDIQSFFPSEADIYAYQVTQSSVTPFGLPSEVFTVETVMHRQLDHLAAAMNDIYRTSALKNGYDAPVWEDLSYFLQQSNIAAADHLFTKIRILLKDETSSVTSEVCRKAYEIYASLSEEQKQPLRELEHERWMRFHAFYNWSYAPVRDNQHRKHPLYVPFASLSHEEQVKDDYAYELLSDYADYLEKKKN